MRFRRACGEPVGSQLRVSLRYIMVVCSRYPWVKGGVCRSVMCAPGSGVVGRPFIDRVVADCGCCVITVMQAPEVQDVGLVRDAAR